MKRHVLILARADVAVALRTEISTAAGFDVTGWLAAVPFRRVGDVSGSVSHYAAHGLVPVSLWDGIVDALDTATAGVRDSVQWQDSGSQPIGDANWAIAYDGVDVVAGFQLSEDDGGVHSSPMSVLTSLGFVPTSSDDTP